ncbi:unnamed protein product [Leptidea sinapis]|uniref:Uncharacterized protein n=1 Tax=Leptidea sinapis TaxID=189913 RepID=A0A5E4Q2K0_9NEOP|nr:unnamed protein product [Leptidea sinapis]
MFHVMAVFLFVLVVKADITSEVRSRGPTLKPISTCCDIPELGDPKPLSECSTPKLTGPCNDVQCVFEKSGFLIDKNRLNKDIYRGHLLKWLESHEEWRDAVHKAIRDCVDRDLRQYLDYPCKSYDVFTCTGIAMLKDVASQMPSGPPCGPPPVDKPFECCKIPPLFTNEELADCGIEKMSDGPSRGPPDCSKQVCMLKKYDLMNGDSVNKEAVAAFLKKYSEANGEFKGAVDKAIEVCLKDDLPGPSQLCEAEKIVACTFFETFANCPTWVKNDKCDKLKDHMDECLAKYNQN